MTAAKALDGKQLSVVFYQDVVKRSEVAPNKPKTKLEDISEALLNFFNPGRLQLTLRLFALGIGGMIILGCLPFFCCTYLQGSKCANPLLRANKEVEQIVQKQTDRSENIGGYLLDLLREDAKDHKRKKKEKMPADLEQPGQDKDASVT
ncbi:unnamed protein product [Caretta caretta]